MTDGWFVARGAARPWTPVSRREKALLLLLDEACGLLDHDYSNPRGAADGSGCAACLLEDRIDFVFDELFGADR